MDWKDLIVWAKPMIAGSLPALGSMIGSTLPIPGGATMGEWAGRKIAEALGVPQTPEAVNDALQKATPGTVADALAAAETDAQVALEDLKARLADVQDARSQTTELAKIHSPLAYAPIVISAMVVVGFCAISFIAMKPDYVGVGNRDVVLFLLGAWSGYMSAVVAYFLGSSSGSSVKSDQLAVIAAKAAGAPAVVRKK